MFEPRSLVLDAFKPAKECGSNIDNQPVSKKNSTTYLMVFLLKRSYLTVFSFIFVLKGNKRLVVERRLSCLGTEEFPSFKQEEKKKNYNSTYIVP